jgi:hypothetical protein
MLMSIVRASGKSCMLLYQYDMKPSQITIVSITDIKRCSNIPLSQKDISPRSIYSMIPVYMCVCAGVGTHFMLHVYLRKKPGKGLSGYFCRM